MRELKRMNFQTEKERLRSKTDRTLFIEQTNWQLNDCNWDKIFDLDEIKSLVSTFESRLDQFCKICSDIEAWFGQEVVTLGFREDNEKLITLLREKIIAGKWRLSSVRLEHEQREKEKCMREFNDKLKADEELRRKTKLAEQARIDEILACANSHVFEIQTRSDRLIKKCQQDFSDLTDHEILDIKR